MSVSLTSTPTVEERLTATNHRYRGVRQYGERDGDPSAPGVEPVRNRFCSLSSGKFVITPHTGPSTGGGKSSRALTSPAKWEAVQYPPSFSLQSCRACIERVSSPFIDAHSPRLGGKNDPSSRMLTLSSSKHLEHTRQNIGITLAVE